MSVLAPRGGESCPTATTSLRDGTVAHVRAMTPDDSDRLLQFHSTLSPDTTHLRYFTVHPRLSSEELFRFTHVDHVDREALVAIVDDQIIGVGRFDRIAGSTDAEVAFVVTDCWQGRGVGSALFEALTERARTVGIANFVADTLSHNRPMQAVFRCSGLPCIWSFDGGLTHVVIALDGRHSSHGSGSVGD